MDLNLFAYFNYFVTAFTTIFVIVDPPGNIPTFLTLTEGLSGEVRNAISKKSTLIACGILITFTLTGNLILDFFKVSIDGLRIAGGILLFAISVDILMGSRRKEAFVHRDIETSEIDSIAVFPIALPLYTGPGAITATIILSSGVDLLSRGVIIVAVLTVYAIVRATHIYSDVIIRILGKSGSNIIARLMAIFIAAISVEYIFAGLEGKLVGII